MPTDPTCLRRTGTVAHCCGACEQGRQPCATPDACRQPESQPRADEGAGAWVVPIVWLAILACLFIVYEGVTK